MSSAIVGAEDPTQVPIPPPPGPVRRLAWIPVLVALPIALVAWFRLELTSRGWDAHAQRAVVDRVARLGGTYYTTGSDQKGPLWLGVYSAVYRVTGPRTFWFGIGVMITVVAALTCVALVVIVDRLVGRRAVTPWLAVGVFAYLVLGREEYSAVLYSRNLVSCLTAGCFALALVALDQPGRVRRLTGMTLAGGCLGLAVQTMPSAAFSAIVIGAFVAWRTVPRPWRWRVPGELVALIGAAVVVFASVFVWYALRGALHEFWQQWYGYNELYSKSTGRTLPEQLGRGVTNFSRYYADRPLLLVGVVVGVVQLVRHRRALRTKVESLRLAMVCWWLAETLSVTVAQRFFSHYFLLTFTPSAVLLVVAIAEPLARLRPPLRAAGVAAALLLAAVPCRFGAEEGYETLRDFRGFDELAEQRIDGRPPASQALRAEVALLTDPQEYVLVWSKFPWFYTDVDRSAATRFIENRWATGEIYGGDTSSELILPGTWERLMEDITAVTPPVIVVPDDEPIPRGSPLEAYLADHYVVAIDNAPFTVYVVPDRLERLLVAPPSAPFPPALGSSGSERWTVSGSTIAFTPPTPGTPTPGDVLSLDELPTCFELEFLVDNAGPAAFPSLTFRSTGGAYDGLTFGPTITADSYRDGTFAALANADPGAMPYEVRVIVGPHAMAAVVDDTIVAVAERRSHEPLLRPWAEAFTLTIDRYAPRPDLCGAP